KLRPAYPAANAFRDQLIFNDPSVLTIPSRRFGMQPAPVAPPANPGFNPNVPANAGLPLINAPVAPPAPGAPSAFRDATYPILGEPLPSPNWYNDNTLPPGAPNRVNNGGEDLLLSDVISFDIQIAWKDPVTAVQEFVTDPHTGA